MFRDLVMAAVGLVWASVLVLVGGRFVALFAGADSSASLIDSLYARSSFWVQPFIDVLHLNATFVNEDRIFEPASLIAFVVYLIGGFLLLTILRVSLFGSGRRDYA
jgi:hypothetical protein